MVSSLQSGGANRPLPKPRFGALDVGWVGSINPACCWVDKANPAYGHAILLPRRHLRTSSNSSSAVASSFPWYWTLIPTTGAPPQAEIGRAHVRPPVTTGPLV